MNSSNQQHHINIIDNTIQQRRTLKVFGDLEKPPVLDNDFVHKVDDAIKIASWAPFHYPAHASHLKHEMDSIVPWRFYAFKQKDCLQLADCLLRSKTAKMKKKSNIIRMLAASGSLVMVTWLPEPDEKKSLSAKKQTINEAHLAAASAATQNLLLALEVRDLQGYWSSGGVLGSKECYSLCGIPANEKLLGAIFVFPKQTEAQEVRYGKHRDKRGTAKSWMTWVNLQ